VLGQQEVGEGGQAPLDVAVPRSGEQLCSAGAVVGGVVLRCRLGRHPRIIARWRTPGEIGGGGAGPGLR
jgi:hypothetical protein